MGIIRTIAGGLIVFVLSTAATAQSFDYKQCGKCGATLPNSVGVGDTCPSCGVYFAREISADPEEAAADDAKTDAFALKFLGGIVLVVVVVGAGGFAIARHHFKQQQAHWDRYMESVKERQPARNKPRKKKKTNPDWI